MRDGQMGLPDRCKPYAGGPAGFGGFLSNITQIALGGWDQGGALEVARFRLNPSISKTLKP